MSTRVRGVGVVDEIATKQTMYFTQCKYETKWII